MLGALASVEPCRQQRLVRYPGGTMLVRAGGAAQASAQRPVENDGTVDEAAHAQEGKRHWGRRKTVKMPSPLVSLLASATAPVATRLCAFRALNSEGQVETHGHYLNVICRRQTLHVA